MGVGDGRWVCNGFIVVSGRGGGGRGLSVGFGNGVIVGRNIGVGSGIGVIGGIGVSR